MCGLFSFPSSPSSFCSISFLICVFFLLFIFFHSSSKFSSLLIYFSSSFHLVLSVPLFFFSSLFICIPLSTLFLQPLSIPSIHSYLLLFLLPSCSLSSSLSFSSLFVYLNISISTLFFQPFSISLPSIFINLSASLFFPPLGIEQWDLRLVYMI